METMISLNSLLVSLKNYADWAVDSLAKAPN